MKNWKTSLLGVLSGLAIFTGSVVQNRVNDPKAAPITAGNVLPALAIAALGLVAKDHDVTGGSR